MLSQEHHERAFSISLPYVYCGKLIILIGQSLVLDEFETNLSL